MTPVLKYLGWKQPGLSGSLFLSLAVFQLVAAALPGRAAEARPGLTLSVSANGAGPGGDADILVSPRVELFVPAGQPVTPFVSAGKIQAVWTGAIVMDLRSEYAFQAELNGQVKLEINGQTVLEGTSDGSSVPSGKGVRLGKGKNPVRVTFASPARGNAFLRLFWTDKPGKGIPFEPVPDAVWDRGTNSVDDAGPRRLRLGRELMIERRCLKCHDAALGPGALPELGMDAPAFDGIGSRRRADWIAEWVRDPRAIRPSARMPKVLHGPNAPAQAELVALYLASLKEGGGPAPVKEADAGEAEAGEKLFTTLNCAGCHLAPDSTDDDPAKIPLKRVAQKFTPGALASFLTKPEAHYSWIRMPNFKFSPAEASGLAAWLLSTAEKPKEDGLKSAPEKLAEGRKLVQSSGCLNCHALKEENRFSARNLAALTHWDQGCMATPAAGTDSAAPAFGLEDEERVAIQTFVKSPVFAYSLRTDVPTEFAERQTRLLNCRACHGQMEGFPPLEIVGGKLKPEWMKAFIGGEVASKPRHWLPARMPAFTSRAGELAEGLVMQHGVAPVSPADPPVNMDLAAVGRKLVSVNGGFSCVLCHGVNKTPAMQVFESEGVNFGRSAARLQTAYFYRWVRNPQGIDPQTKMPKFFSEGDKSPLADILDGDIQKQLDAIWNYLRLGEKMQPPPGPSGQ